MRRFCLAFCGLGALLLLTFAAIPTHADDWNKSYKLTGRPNLRVITNDGHVDLYATSGNQLDAHVATNGWPIGDRGVRITESQTGNEVDLEVHVPTFHFSFGWNDRSVRIQLNVPREADFDVETGDGSVTSQAFHGQLRISTGDGNIEANGLTGQVRLHSGDGHIRGDGFDGELRADSGDGNIDVTGRFDSLSLNPATAASPPRCNPARKSLMTGRCAPAMAASRFACPMTSTPISTPTPATATSLSRTFPSPRPAKFPAAPFTEKLAPAARRWLSTPAMARFTSRRSNSARG